MTSEVVLIGIHFRSLDHVVWFLGSMLIFLVNLGWFVYGVLSSWPKSMRFRRLGPLDWWRALATPHLVTSVTALIFTLGGVRNDRLFSRDCIWFNALMAAIYWGMYQAGRRLVQKHILAVSASARRRQRRARAVR